MPSSPIRMLKFITSFTVGGTERQFVRVATGLDRKRFDLRLGCIERTGTFLEDIERTDIPVSEYKTPSMYSFETLKGQLRLARYIRREKIQLVHAYDFYPNVFTVPAVRFAGNCLSITSVRDTGVFSSQKAAKGTAQRIVCRLSDCIVANSNAVRTWLISQGLPADRIRVIPNGVTVGQLEPLTDYPIRREFGIRADAPVVTVVCRLYRGKGLEYFIQAAVRVKARFPDTRFLIVGDSLIEPQYRTELQNLADQQGLAGRLFLTGQRSDVSQIYRESTAFVLPSLSEGFSNVLLEAMAHGLPTVATNVGGNPEIVINDQTGFLIPAKEPEALSDAMIRLIASPQLSRQFGEAGRKRVSDNFSMESTLHRTEELYAELVERKKK